MNNELSPAQLAKLAKWLPEVVFYGGESDQSDALRWKERHFVNGVLTSELDYLCRMAEAKLTREQSEWQENQLISKYQPAAGMNYFRYMMSRTPSQRIDALPEPKE